MTSCLEIQKQEMDFLNELFSKKKKVFQITSSSMDELNCQFSVDNDQKYHLHVDFPSTYPVSPPLWSALDSENEVIQAVLGMLLSTNGAENHIVHQIKTLIEILCFQFSLQLPEPEMTQLNSYLSDQQFDSSNVPSTSKLALSSMPSNKQPIVIVDSSDEDEEMPAVPEIVKKAHMIKVKLESEQSKNPSAKKETSSSATRRIMNEVKALTVGDAVKNQLIEFDLVKESLYEWQVKLMAKAFDSESEFYKDLNKTKNKFVLLSVEFNAKFPFDPPFIRVLEPVIHAGHIERGGALCMEVVMHRGWLPVFTMENLFLQIAATIVKGNGRVNFRASTTKYNRKEALMAFKWLERIYDPNTSGGKNWAFNGSG